MRKRGKTNIPGGTTPNQAHRDPTQKLNQTNNFYYRNSYMEIKKKSSLWI